MPSRGKTLPTWSGESSFRYEGSVTTGITIRCGSEFSRRYSLCASQLREVLTLFAGREVPIGTHRTAPPKGSIGEWILLHFKRGGMMSYLGPILIEEGYAQRGDRAGFAGIDSSIELDRVERF